MRTPRDIMLELIEEKETSLSAWEGTPFEKMKLIASTEKGDIAEDFLAALLAAYGYTDIEVKKGRRGHYDVSLNKKVFFEVKAATQDVSGGFQFNGIRYDTKYTHLFCLGIIPDNLFYLIINKTKLISGEYHLVSMARGSNASFKLSRTLKQMKEFDTFAKDVKIALDETKDNRPTKGSKKSSK